MQYLLYRTDDAANPVYKRYYIASWSGIIPELVRKGLEYQDKGPEDFSLAGLHAEIEKVIMDACIKNRASKQLKKQSR